MRVKKLIALLKMMPQDAECYTADHDHGSMETNGIISSVQYVDQSRCDEHEAYQLERNPEFKINKPYVRIGV